MFIFYIFQRGSFFFFFTVESPWMSSYKRKGKRTKGKEEAKEGEEREREKDNGGGGKRSLLLFSPFDETLKWPLKLSFLFVID